MTIQIEAPAARPGPAARSALDAALATLRDERQRRQLRDLAARADFRIDEVSVYDTEFGLEAQLSGQGRLLTELLD